MTTSFKAKFPIKALTSIQAYSRETGLTPDQWAKKQTPTLTVGDKVVTTALMLVFSIENGSPVSILVTEDFYVIDFSENIFRERASALASQSNMFSYAIVPLVATIPADKVPFMNGMRRWGTGGSRSAPPLGLPDPLVAFLSCIGATVQLSPILSISVLAASLVKGPDGPSTPDLRAFYPRITNYDFRSPAEAESFPGIAGGAPTPGISSVTVIEEKPNDTPSSLLAKFESQTRTESTASPFPITGNPSTANPSTANPFSTPAVTSAGSVPPPPLPNPAIPNPATANPFYSDSKTNVPPNPLTDSPSGAGSTQPVSNPFPANAETEWTDGVPSVPVLPPLPAVPPLPKFATNEQSSWDETESTSSNSTGPASPIGPINPMNSIGPISGASSMRKLAPGVGNPEEEFQKKLAELEAAELIEKDASDDSDLPASPLSQQTGRSVRNRLEARLEGKLPKGMDPFSELHSSTVGRRLDSASPVVRLVSNIRQQVNIAGDNLEYRVSALKSRMLDQLVTSKHDLSEKEQKSLRSMEELRAMYQKRLEETAARSKEELTKAALEGSSRVKAFQGQAISELARILESKQAEINQTAIDARQKVQDTVAGGKGDLTKTVNRTQQTLRGLVGTTEVNLSQLQAQTLKSMDERIDGFRAQSQILTEGISLSVESLAEAAKLQGQQSQDEVAKRLDDLSTEAVKSLREQTVKAEMECTKLIDKLAREKLLPMLQDRRKYSVELAGSFQDEFAEAIQHLLDAKLAEFDPLIRANSEFCAASLRDFRSRWLGSLEDHQESLEVLHENLERKVSEYMTQARAKVESIQDISRVAETVLSSPELIRTRDETCLKFDIIARDYISRSYAHMGDRVQVQKLDALDELVQLRERAESNLRNRGEEGRARIRTALKNAMHKIQELQTLHTS